MAVGRSDSMRHCRNVILFPSRPARNAVEAGQIRRRRTRRARRRPHQYALSGLDKSIAVTDWKTQITESLPAEFRGSLPTVEEIEAELTGETLPNKEMEGDAPWIPSRKKCRASSLRQKLLWRIWQPWCIATHPDPDHARLRDTLLPKLLSGQLAIQQH